GGTRRARGWSFQTRLPPARLCGCLEHPCWCPRASRRAPSSARVATHEPCWTRGDIVRPATQSGAHDRREDERSKFVRCAEETRQFLRPELFPEAIELFPSLALAGFFVLEAVGPAGLGIGVSEEEQFA